MDFINFYHDISVLKSILYKNSYRRDFVDKYMKELLERVLTPKIVVSTVPKNDLMIVVPHFEKPSLQICSSVNRVIKNKLPYCNRRIVSQTKRKLINSITFKDNISVFLRSYIVFEFKCVGCIATYDGKTKHHFKVEMCEHLGLSVLTGRG